MPPRPFSRADTPGMNPRSAALGLVALAATIGLLGSAPAVAAPVREAPSAPAPVITQALPAGYDAQAVYEAQQRCQPSPRPGTRALAALITRTYGSNQSIGLTRACSIGGTSEHKDGRAIDWMTSIRSKQGRANARAFLAWLLGPDAAGTPFGNATRLGIMYIGWNDRFWAAYDTGRGWTELRNCFSTPGRGSDTTCHRNHIHISLTWDGASGRTSMWDGTALPAFCPAPRSGAGPASPGRATDVVAVPPVRVLSTREGLGLSQGTYTGWGGYDDGPADVPTDPFAVPAPAAAPVPQAPCRLHRSGWRGDQGGILTKVTGQGGVPDTGVAAVAVTVRVLGSTAPAEISVWVPGLEGSAVVARVRMNRGASGSAIVPVASDGTIGLTTSAGGADVTVDVTGYYLVGAEPNTTAVALRR